MARGGYRKPANPAPVSGPGRLSRRTDGAPAQNVAELPNAGYGEASQFRDLEGAARMAASPMPGPTGPSSAPTPSADLAGLLGGASPAAPPTPLTQDTLRPNEPISAGAPFGPGPGPAPEVAAPSGRLTDLLERLLQNDLTGEIADMYTNAARRGL